jgi:hypothetical protein
MPELDNAGLQISRNYWREKWISLMFSVGLEHPANASSTFNWARHVGVSESSAS